ncbi:MAG: YrbL family protein [Akkermansiaceae bacterium]
MKGDTIIELKDEHFIDAGAYCRCYENPLDLNECIKVTRTNSKAKKRLRVDLSYYRKLHRYGVDLKHVADYLGACKTSVGDGYRYECVRDSDASISKTLKHYFNQPDVDKEKLYSLLDDLGNYLVKNKILINDMHSENILVRVEDDGEFHLVIVDGIGDRVAITMFNLIPSLLKAKIIRRWNRYARKELENNALLSED